MRKVVSALFIFICLLVADIMAQPPVGGPSGDPGPAGPDNIPIDGGIGFLIAAGLLYGGKKLIDHNRSKR